eukprot:10444514-Lingulodinium_polyedra.AAC.1
MGEPGGPRQRSPAGAPPPRPWPLRGGRPRPLPRRPSHGPAPAGTRAHRAGRGPPPLPRAWERPDPP